MNELLCPPELDSGSNGKGIIILIVDFGSSPE